MQGVPVWSLVGELRSHVLHRAAKIKKKLSFYLIEHAFVVKGGPFWKETWRPRTKLKSSSVNSPSRDALMRSLRVSFPLSVFAGVIWHALLRFVFVFSSLGFTGSASPRVVLAAGALLSVGVGHRSSTCSPPPRAGSQGVSRVLLLQRRPQLPRGCHQPVRQFCLGSSLADVISHTCHL